MAASRLAAALAIRVASRALLSAAALLAAAVFVATVQAQAQTRPPASHIPVNSIEYAAMINPGGW